MEIFKVSVVPAGNLSPRDRKQIVSLCSEVFETDYSLFLDQFHDVTHVVGHFGAELATHALWMPRTLLLDGNEAIESAYVEGVATWPRYRGRGFAAEVMRCLHREIVQFDLGALATGIPGWYEPLGWTVWLGPKYIRRGESLTETPEDCVMVYQIPGKMLPDISKSLTAEWRPNELW